MMTADNDLKEILTEIKQEFANLNRRLDKIDEDLTNIKVSQAELKGEMTGLNKRLDNAEFINRTIFVSIVVALTAGVAKIFGLLPNP